ncbi:hypothetical protein [Streptococcus hyointestinalis]|uniref:hypothetical protein n=1 Tax=Streptococcus hyointestinalis TaxID=1337 RepID=UPI0013DFD8B0|nr:hypothetical protein [Streptococcus hyointestinalis]
MMTRKEKQSRKAIINFLISEMGISYNEAQASLEELVSVGLVNINSSGQFSLKVV